MRSPENFQCVPYHWAHLQAHTICTHHTGLLLRRKTGYTHLQKAGGRGPFVRFDFEDKSDLLPWMAGVFNEREHRNAQLFVTFNDTDIVKLDPP